MLVEREPEMRIYLKTKEEIAKLREVAGEGEVDEITRRLEEAVAA